MFVWGAGGLRGRVCVRTCVRVCVYVRAWMCVSMCMFVFVLYLTVLDCRFTAFVMIEGVNGNFYTKSKFLM